MGHYDCKECHQDPVSGHAPDCSRGNTLSTRLTEASVHAAEMAIMYRRGGCSLDANILRLFSEIMGQAADEIASARIKGDKDRENPVERPQLANAWGQTAAKSPTRTKLLSAQYWRNAMEPSEKLKPCPFCGSKALVGQTLDYAWYAMCEKDFCCKLDSYWKTEAEAIAAWNTRDQRALNEAAAKERAAVVDLLSGLSSYVGAGIGDDATTSEQFVARIRWGIEHLERVARKRAADIVEECSKRPGTTWGEVKRAVEQGAHHDPE